MKLAYQAMDKTGQLVNDLIDASTPLEATELLRREGLFVTELKEAGAGRKAAKPRGSRSVGTGKHIRSVAMFTRQLSVLITTGTPLVQAITALEKQTKNDAWCQVVSNLREHLEGGDSFTQALESHPECFDSVYRSLVQAGETGGQLGEMLMRLARLTRQRMRVRSLVMGAMMYPMILIVIATSVLGIMIGFVLPRFTGLFETLDTPLPPTTQFLLLISEVMRNYWWGLLPMFGVITVLVVMVIKSDTGRRKIDLMSLKLPKFGQLFRSFATAQLTRLLGILLNSKVPLLEAIKLTRDGCANSSYAKLLSEAEEALTRGDTLSSVLARSDLIDVTITEAVRCGEQTGQMGSVLVNIADFLDEENEITLKSLSSIIEPLILIVLGVLVGLVAVSMFMPLFDITAAVPGGG